MKKLLAIVSSIFLLNPLSAFAISATPNTAYLSSAPDYQVLAECENASDQYQLYVFAPNGDNSPNNSSGRDCDQFPGYIFTDVSGDGFFYYEQVETVAGTYTLIEAGIGADCSTISACEAAPYFVGEVLVSMFDNLSSFSIPTSFVPSFTSSITDTLSGMTPIIAYSIALVSLFWIMGSIIGIFRGKEDLKFQEKINKRRGGRKRRGVNVDELIDYGREDINFVRGFGDIGKE